jgi:hypothetical protein
VTSREHARLARELITACGGLDECAANCRVSKANLSRYQNPHEECFMPADVIADLETYCGRPIYSAALFDRFEQPKAEASDLREAVFTLTEESADLQRVAREVLADGRITPRELDRLAEEERQADAALQKVRAARQAAEAAQQRPALKAV